MRRITMILLAVGFLLPANAATPDDELRALYAVQGMLCADDKGDHVPAESHCVLCLVAAFDSNDSALGIVALRRGAVDQTPLPATPNRAGAALKSHHARAPPASFA